MANFDKSLAYHQTSETVAVVEFWVVFARAVQAISEFSEGGFRGAKTVFLRSSCIFVLVIRER